MFNDEAKKRNAPSPNIRLQVLCLVWTTKRDQIKLHANTKARDSQSVTTLLKLDAQT
jgi:hypothetical protein